MKAMAPELAMLKLQKKKTDTMTPAQAIIFIFYFVLFFCSSCRRKTRHMTAGYDIHCIIQSIKYTSLHTNNEQKFKKN
jgi:hypothetical protein